MTSSRLKVVTLPAATRFKKSVKPPTANMLKSGRNNKKLGGVVTKGAWKGYPLYSLTLEERATCPADCDQWDTCYGNNMPFAHRFNVNNPQFIDHLAADLKELDIKHWHFVVRLHVLGDFYSRSYVTAWRHFMSEHPGLHVFGYTHHKPWTSIGKMINSLNESYKTRWRIRFSNADAPFSAHVVQEEFIPDNGIVCPEQLGKTKSCASCAYCWGSENPVFFLEH